MQTAALTGEQYFSTLRDAKSHHVSIYLQKTKDQTLSCFQIYAPRAEIITGEHINLFQSDGGGEYRSEGFKTYLHEKGIQHEKTNTYTPEENGVSEQMNWTLVEMACYLLHDATLPDTFWGYAVQHSACILNSLPSHALDSSMMPEEIFTGNKPSIANLRISGCKAYTHIPKEKRCKLDVKMLECIYIGYADNRKAYRLYHKPSRWVFESCDVTFNEGTSI
jgi:hypothetical protein